MRKFVNRMFDLLCVSSPLQRPPTLSTSVYLSRVKTTHFANLTGKQSSKNMNEFVFDQPRWCIWPCQVSSEIRTSYKVEPHTQHHPACEATQTPLSEYCYPYATKTFIRNTANTQTNNIPLFIFLYSLDLQYRPSDITLGRLLHYLLHLCIKTF